MTEIIDLKSFHHDIHILKLNLRQAIKNNDILAIQQFKREMQEMHQSQIKYKSVDQEKINRDKKTFFENGGKIKVVNFGVSGRVDERKKGRAFN